jgi:hypothetical protein
MITRAAARCRPLVQRMMFPLAEDPAGSPIRADAQNERTGRARPGCNGAVRK